MTGVSEPFPQLSLIQSISQYKFPSFQRNNNNKSFQKARKEEKKKEKKKGVKMTMNEAFCNSSYMGEPSFYNVTQTSWLKEVSFTWNTPI